jgi:hypothetical protein
LYQRSQAAYSTLTLTSGTTARMPSIT